MKTTLAVCIIVVFVFATLYHAVRDSSFLIRRIAGPLFLRQGQ
jgi:ABC-type polysaccharide/polyol phosphate export permease